MRFRLEATLILALLGACGKLDDSQTGCPAAKPGLDLPARRAAPVVPHHVLAFYYPWFGSATGPSGVWRHWNPNLPRYGVAHKPVAGYYDSKDTTILRRHLQQMKAAGIDTVVASWWGPEQFEDQVLPVLLSLAQAEGLSVSALIETGGNCNELRNSLQFLLDRRAGNPVWLRVDGKPVVFI